MVDFRHMMSYVGIFRTFQKLNKNGTIPFKITKMGFIFGVTGSCKKTEKIAKTGFLQYPSMQISTAFVVTDPVHGPIFNSAENYTKTSC